jgi:hypothetical protein
VIGAGEGADDGGAKREMSVVRLCLFTKSLANEAGRGNARERL